MESIEQSEITKQMVLKIRRERHARNPDTTPSPETNAAYYDFCWYNWEGRFVWDEIAGGPFCVGDVASGIVVVDIEGIAQAMNIDPGPLLREESPFHTIRKTLAEEFNTTVYKPITKEMLQSMVALARNTILNLWNEKVLFTMKKD